jgi:hypothetical protein
MRCGPQRVAPAVGRSVNVMDSGAPRLLNQRRRCAHISGSWTGAELGSTRAPLRLELAEPPCGNRHDVRLSRARMFGCLTSGKIAPRGADRRDGEGVRISSPPSPSRSSQQPHATDLRHSGVPQRNGLDIEPCRRHASASTRTSAADPVLARAVTWPVTALTTQGCGTGAW